MPFPVICPSSGADGRSVNNVSQTTERMRSDPRCLRGEKESDSSVRNTSSKRRRVPPSVTRNACLNCRRARAKCDGEQPCQRCASRAEHPECLYEAHIKNKKGELIDHIKELKATNRVNEQILQALRNEEKVPEIFDQLKNGETYENIVNWLSQSLKEGSRTLPPSESQQFMLKASDDGSRGTNLTTFQWTSVTSDTAVLDHLFQLYFAWVHPVHTLFSEGHFMDSYRRRSEVYCSSVLVNALCAMACHLHSVAEADEVDFKCLGTEFSDAARAGINAEDKTITTIQAFAVIFLVDCARANSLRASSYLEVAINNLANVAFLEGDEFPEVWKDTVYGIRNLNVEWAQMTFKVPPIVHLAQLELMKESIEKIDESKWHFYRYMNDQCLARPSLLTTTNREKSKLIEIINDIAIMMYAPHSPRVSAHDILQQYNRLVTWRVELSSIIGRIESDSSQALPHALSLLILHSATVVQLLRPLLDLEGFTSPLVTQTIWDHAQRGLFLLDERYRRQYTCRYQPVLQMFAVLHLTDVVARFFQGSVQIPAKDGPEAIKFGMEVLIESQIGFAVAGPLQQMLRKTAEECSIRPARYLNKFMAVPPPPRQVYDIDDLIGACTRLTYVQPVDQIHKRYLSTVCTDWTPDGESYSLLEPTSDASRLRFPPNEKRAVQNLMQIRNLPYTR